MFYEKLAQAKDEKRRLSTKQKLGVGAAGVLTPTLLKRLPLVERHILSRGEDKIREAFNKERSRIKDDLVDLHVAERVAPLHKNRLNDISVGDELPISGPVQFKKHIFEDTEYKQKIDDVLRMNKRKKARITEGVKKQLDLLSTEQLPLPTSYLKDAETAANKNIRMHESIKDTKLSRARKLKLGVLGLTGAYGAKKLFDRYNQRKQQRS